MHFPFTAVCGQEPFKLALILAAIDPGIGGVLVSGPRGSAKSTLARGMADILQPSRFVTLPLGATTEMVVGTLSLEQVLENRRARFQPGLLAKADGGVLYVDEVNLLPDHLVDLLLDVSSSGINHVERDGVSHQHTARFVLLGTMNPDEGELRAQLQDRFGLSVGLGNRYSTRERMDIVRLREAFDADPVAFTQSCAQQQQALTNAVARAKERLPSISCPDELREQIATGCMQANVDGLRADIVWLRAACAHAAYQGRTEVTPDDIAHVAELVLAHRRNPSTQDSDQSGSSSQHEHSADTSGQMNHAFKRPSERSGHLSNDALNDASSDPTKPESGSDTDKPGASSGNHGSMTREASGEDDNSNTGGTDSLPAEGRNGDTAGGEGDWGRMPPQIQAVASAHKRMKPLSTDSARQRGGKQGHPPTVENSRLPGQGARGSLATENRSRSINWFTTLIANAGQWPLHTFRFRRVRTGESVLHLILLDTSASTLQSQWFAHAKGLVLEIAGQVYRARAQLAIIGFGHRHVQMLLPRRRAPKSLKSWLDVIPAGGGTPMRQIVEHALQYQQRQRRRDPGIALKTYLITDGRTSQSFHGLSLLGDVTVIDIEQSAIRRGRARDLSAVLGASYRALPA